MTPLPRPALRVVNGEFSDPPPAWRRLETHRDRIRARLPSIGRIHHGSSLLGTGILVAETVVMTNRHVAESFASDVDGVAKVRTGWKPVIDFLGEAPLETARAQAEIRRILVMHANEAIDLALLDVTFDDTTGPEPWRRPRPMRLHTSSGSLSEHRPIYVVGFPVPDGVKRVQPGFITRLRIDDNAFEFEHDASTATGNSGSCVIDLDTDEVIGLHTRGARDEHGHVGFNRALAFSRLSADDLRTLREAGVDVSAPR